VAGHQAHAYRRECRFTDGGTMSQDADESRPVVDALADLDELPVAEHVARFEAVHDALRARLAGEATDGGTA
jgi:hypothetical protein